MRFVSRVIVSAIALWLVTLMTSSIRVVRPKGSTLYAIGVFLVIGFVLTIVNLVVKPLAKVIAFPLYIITLGLFGLVINALMLMLASWLTHKMGLSFGLHVNGFWAAFWCGLLLSVLSAIIGIPFKHHERSRRG